VTFLLITSDYGDIWQKNPSKIENKNTAITLPANMDATEPVDLHQPQVQNIYGCFFATGRFEDLTFCKPNVLQT
jgi:hypothetical protein